MPSPLAANRRLLVEFLETRTLLAGDATDPYGLVGDFNLAMSAVTGSGAFQGTFSINFGNHQLVLSGTSDSNITVDLDKLPGFVTNLRITAFDNVTFVGADSIETLVVTDVHSVNAKDLSVTGSLHVTDVDSVTLASAGPLVLLKGDATSLTSATLENTTIYSDLHALTLMSDSKSIYVVSLNDHQSVTLQYLPEAVFVTGLPQSSIHIALPGPTGGGEVHTPGTGSAGSGSTGSETPTPSDTGSVPTGAGGSSSDTPDRVVIISLPADERTRVFLAELRALLHSSSASDTQRILSFVRNGPNGAEKGAPSVSLSGAVPVASDSHSAILEGIWGTETADFSVLGSEWKQSPAVDLQRLESPFPVLDQDRERVTLPDHLADLGAADIEVTWPHVLTPSSDNSPPGEIARRSEGDGGEISIEESVRALGSYIVDRVTAEFSPGQQSIVLLVDPRPTRSPSSNRRTALEIFSADVDESVIAGESVA